MPLFVAMSVAAAATWPQCSLAFDQKAVTFIELFRKGDVDPTVVGTGFLVDLTGHMITARHLFDQADAPQNDLTIKVHFGAKDSLARTAQLVDCGLNHIDICLVKVSASAVRSEGVAAAFEPLCRALVPGEDLTSMGFPPGVLNPMITVKGEVTGDLATTLKYPSDIQIQAGMSGGPVLDQGGRVIAINTGVASGSGTFAFVQPLSYGIDVVEKSGVTCGSAPPLEAGDFYIHDSDSVQQTVTFSCDANDIMIAASCTNSGRAQAAVGPIYTEDNGRRFATCHRYGPAGQVAEGQAVCLRAGD